MTWALRSGTTLQAAFVGSPLASLDVRIDEVTKYISLIVDQNIYLNKVINCCSGKPISIKNLSAYEF